MTYTLENEEHNGLLHNGFEIKMLDNVCDIIDGKYKAYVINSSNILTECPSIPYGFLHKGNAYEQTAKSTYKYNSLCQQQHKVMQNAVLGGSANWAKKFLLLKFPSSVTLSSNVPNKKSIYKNWVHMDWMPHTETYNIVGNNSTNHIITETTASIS